MNIKKEYLVLIIVIVALSLYLILGRDDQPGSDLPRMTALDNTTIKRMVITQKDSAIELMHKEDRWYIEPNNYLADPIQMKNMVKAATELTVTAQVSVSRNYERYNLNKTQRINVQIHGEDRLQREFDIGRTAPTSQHTFVRLTDNPSVYHAKGNLHTTFNQTIDGLRDKTILSIEKEAITSLRLLKNDIDQTWTKTEVEEEADKDDKEASSAAVTKTQWIANNDNTTSDKGAVNALLSILAGLKCDNYMEDDAKTGLTEAAWTVTLKNDSHEWTISIFAPQHPEATQIPGTSSSNDYAFLLSKQRVESIEKQIEELLKP